MISTQIEHDDNPRIPIGDRVSIRRRGRLGKYCADFWINGQHKRKSLRTSNLKIARQRAIQLEADLADGEYAAPAKPVLVADAARQFVDAIKAVGRAHKTVIAYEAECKTFVRFLKLQHVHKLSQINSKLFLAYRADRQQTLAEKTIYTRLIIIKTFINWCCNAGEMLEHNPLRRCKVDTPYTSPKFSPTLLQVNSILAKATSPRLVQFAVLAFAGIRVGELSMLRPCDVDLKGGWIHIVGRPGWLPKTRQARRVPVHSKLMPLLSQYAKTLTDSEARAYVFSDEPDGSRPINVRTINLDLQASAKSLGIQVGRASNGLVVHSLRHFFETQAVDSGVPQFVVDQWMGHRGPALMGRIYYGHSDEKSVRFMKQVKF